MAEPLRGRHIDRNYDDALRELKHKLLEMGGLVEQQIAGAIRALMERDSEAARRTILGDQELDRLEITLDDECTRLLALHQPAARDLRLITTALKITTDLERMGDQAENICERVMDLNREPQLKPYVDLPRMAMLVQGMVGKALDAFVRKDTTLALAVCAQDDQVDALTAEVIGELVQLMKTDPAHVDRAMALAFIAKYLERIGDHATNIAEMVIYMVRGKSIRHLKKLPNAV